MIDSEKNHDGNLDDIRRAEVPKTLFQSFWNRVFVLELQYKIKESLLNRDYSKEKFENTAVERFMKEKEYCKIILDGFEEFIKENKPENSIFLWDIQGTIGIYLTDFTIHDSIEQLMGYIKSMYPELKMGVLTDCDIAFIKKIFETPKGSFLKKYINPDLYFSVFEDEPGPDSEKPIHDYSNLLEKLGSELDEKERTNIRKVDPHDRKKKITKLLKTNGSSVFAVDDLPWAKEIGVGVKVNSMYLDFDLYD